MAQKIDRSASEQSSARNLKVGAVVLLAALVIGVIMTAVGMRHNGLATAPPVAQNNAATRAPLETRGEGSAQEPNFPQGQNSPQGPTGPLDTKSGGAPAASPQGETPPGMQSAPSGSNEKM
jgi:hypothetical protein